MRNAVAVVVTTGALGAGLLLGVAPAQAGDVGGRLPTPPSFGISGNYHAVRGIQQCTSLRKYHPTLIAGCTENSFKVKGRISVTTVAVKAKNAAAARKLGRSKSSYLWSNLTLTGNGPVKVHGVPGDVWKASGAGQFGDPSCTSAPSAAGAVAINGNRVVQSFIMGCNRQLNWASTATNAAKVVSTYAQPSRFPL